MKVVAALKNVPNDVQASHLDDSFLDVLKQI